MNEAPVFVFHEGTLPIDGKPGKERLMLLYLGAPFVDSPEFKLTKTSLLDFSPVVNILPPPSS